MKKSKKNNRNNRKLNNKTNRKLNNRNNRKLNNKTNRKLNNKTNRKLNNKTNRKLNNKTNRKYKQKGAERFHAWVVGLVGTRFFYHYAPLVFTSCGVVGVICCLLIVGLLLAMVVVADEYHKDFSRGGGDGKLTKLTQAINKFGGLGALNDELQKTELNTSKLEGLLTLTLRQGIINNLIIHLKGNPGVMEDMKEIATELGKDNHVVMEGIATKLGSLKEDKGEGSKEREELGNDSLKAKKFGFIPSELFILYLCLIIHGGESEDIKSNILKFTIEKELQFAIIERKFISEALRSHTIKEQFGIQSISENLLCSKMCMENDISTTNLLNRLSKKKKIFTIWHKLVFQWKKTPYFKALCE
jgi:hypothetical protein